MNFFIECGSEFLKLFVAIYYWKSLTIAWPWSSVLKRVLAVVSTLLIISKKVKGSDSVLLIFLENKNFKKVLISEFVNNYLYLIKRFLVSTISSKDSRVLQFQHFVHNSKETSLQKIETFRNFFRKIKGPTNIFLKWNSKIFSFQANFPKKILEAFLLH